VTVNRKYLRIFLIFLILFGAYQIYEILAIKDPSVSATVTTGAVLLIATVIVSAGWFLKNIK
jgi:hypothetical protein